MVIPVRTRFTAVWPTSARMNPSLTIMAMSLRMACHIVGLEAADVI
jgi:choline dehydrogenase-like flavoprotein